jgi:hypothetical protein
MAWVERNGRCYLYRTVRRDGRVVREYLGCGPVAELAAERDALERRRAAYAAIDARAELAAYRAEIDGLARAVDPADGLLKEAVAILLAADGYHRPRRNRWRKRRRPVMASELRKLDKDLAALIERVKETGIVPAGARPDPLIRCEAPATDPAAVELFARARAAEAGGPTTGQVEQVIRDRGWVAWIGDIGRQATLQLIAQVTDLDPVWGAGVRARVIDLRRELLGPDPSPADELIVRRVVNAWLVVSRLELEQVHRRPRDLREAEVLDRAVSRAQRRLLEAVQALEAVRRLRAPRVLQQVNVSAGPQQVVNAG